MNDQEIINEALKIAALKMLDIAEELRKNNLDADEAVFKYKQYWNLIKL